MWLGRPEGHIPAPLPHRLLLELSLGPVSAGDRGGRKSRGKLLEVLTLPLAWETLGVPPPRVLVPPYYQVDSLPEEGLWAKTVDLSNATES